jgi:hypothetical protein
MKFDENTILKGVSYNFENKKIFNRILVSTLLRGTVFLTLCVYYQATQSVERFHSTRSVGTISFYFLVLRHALKNGDCLKNMDSLSIKLLTKLFFIDKKSHITMIDLDKKPIFHLN